MMALDSGLRLGEILKLHWNDLDTELNIIRVIGTNTKTERERIAPLSQRVKDELEKLKEITKCERPFPFQDIKKSVGTAKKIAKIDDLHFHDLRRTAIVRWQQQDISIALAGKLAGHSQLLTTMEHYTSTDAKMVGDISEQINSYHKSMEIKETVSEAEN